jgi:peptidoglycan/LPS O-acetylase OafA/YrhL
MGSCKSSEESDLLSSRWAMLLLWAVPWVSIIITANNDDLIRTFVWTLGFGVMGVACLINARRCGRLHCFYTTPLFFLAALASLLYGVHILPLGRYGWDWILGVTVAGSLIACCVLERIVGKYPRKDSSLS